MYKKAHAAIREDPQVKLVPKRDIQPKRYIQSSDCIVLVTLSILWDVAFVALTFGFSTGHLYL